MCFPLTLYPPCLHTPLRYEELGMWRKQKDEWHEDPSSKHSSIMRVTIERVLGFVGRNRCRFLFLLWILISMSFAVLIYKLLDDSANATHQLKLNKFCKDHSRVIEAVFDRHFQQIRNALDFFIILNRSNSKKSECSEAQFPSCDLFISCDSSLLPNVDQIAWTEYMKSIMNVKSSFIDFFYVSLFDHEKRSMIESCLKTDIIDWITKLPRTKSDEYAILTHFTSNVAVLKNTDLLTHNDFYELIQRAKMESSISLSDPLFHPFMNNNMTVLVTASPNQLLNYCHENIDSNFSPECNNIGLLMSTISVEKLMSLVLNILPQDDENFSKILFKLEDVTDSKNMSIFSNLNDLKNDELDNPNDFPSGTSNNEDDRIQHQMGDDNFDEIQMTLQSDNPDSNDILHNKKGGANNYSATKQESRCSIIRFLQNFFFYSYFFRIRKLPMTVYESLNLEDANKNLSLSCYYEDNMFFNKTAIFVSHFIFIISILFYKLVYHLIRQFDNLYTELVKVYKFKKSTDASNSAKTTFLATMSHEILAPMNGLLGMIHLLLKTELNPIQNTYAQTALNSGNSILNLVNQVIDFVKIESNQLDLENITINIRALMDEILSTFAGNANEKGIELAALVHTSIPNTILGDHVRLRQAIGNLVDNAIKFTDSGHVFLTVRVLEDDQGSKNLPKKQKWNSSSSSSTSSTQSASQSSFFESDYHSPPSPSLEFQTLSGKQTVDEDNSWDNIKDLLIDEIYRPPCSVFPFSYSPLDRGTLDHSFGDKTPPVKKKIKLLFQVEDTGIGIPSDMKDDIFCPFVKLENQFASLGKKSGIGLTLSQKLINLMGGNLSYVSEIGIGTTFKFHVEFDYFEFPESNPTVTNSAKVQTAITSIEAKNEGVYKDNGTIGKESIEEETEYKSEKSVKIENLPELLGSNNVSLEKEQSNLENLFGVKILVVDNRIVRQQVLASFLKRLGSDVDVCDNIFSSLLAIQHNISQIVSSVSSTFSSPVSSPLSKSPPPIPSTPEARSHSQEPSASSKEALNPNRRSFSSDYLQMNIDYQSSVPVDAHIRSKTNHFFDVFDDEIMNSDENSKVGNESNQLLGEDTKVRTKAKASLRWDIIIVDSDASSEPHRGMHFGFLLLEMKEIRNAIQKGVPLPRLVLATDKANLITGYEPSVGLFSALLFKPLRTKPLADTLLQVLHDDSPTFSQLSEREGMLHAPVTDKSFVLKRVLVVSHDLDSQHALISILLGLGFGSVVCVDSSVEALRRLKSSHSFDLIIMRVDHPVNDSFEFTRRIRNMEDKTSSALEQSLNSLTTATKVKLSLVAEKSLKKRKTPIVGFVRQGNDGMHPGRGDVHEELLQESKACGMDGLIFTPLESSQVRMLLANILS